uniref:Nodule-specific cysteine-rich peptide G07 n=1 Tax=Pisum sativum TaxID=3888 RepID=Q9AVA0_PEA|nr:nodule-specific cysteine-rich peptide G07 [Pisum sativum]BAB40946.1 nodule-specific protein [Pisum sativum]
MAKTLIFVYAFLFLSLFLLLKEADAQISCTKDKDCPDISHLKILIFKCINEICEAVKPDAE